MELPEFEGAKIVDGYLVTRHPLVEEEEAPVSKSGKSKILATSNGFSGVMGSPKIKYSINVIVSV